MNGKALVVAARRTPVAPIGGPHSEVELHRLGAVPALAALSDAGIDPVEVDEVIMGNAIGPGGNPARSIALAAGLPERVAGLTIDRQCSSGLDALLMASALIASGQAEVVLAGGVECYSQSRFVTRARQNGEPNRIEQSAFTPWPDRDPQMADAADRLARLLNISRESQDDWAIDSHKKALLLRDKRSAEFAPIPEAGLKFDCFSRTLTESVCRRARPISGSVTSANSSVAADAGAVCVVMSKSAADSAGCSGAAIVGGATLGGDPELPGLVPVEAMRLVLDRSGVGSADLAAAEIMEAFAVQAIACVRGAGLNPDVVNLGGGSLARGHPVGASGAILAVRLFHEMAAEVSGFGIAAIASAGGLGTALLMEAAG